MSVERLHVLHYDFETRSTCDLLAAGAWRYAADPSTEVLCCAYAVDDEPVQLWAPGNPIPLEFVEAAAGPNWLIASHNNQFELAIETHVLRPRVGWPLIPLERRRCSMAAALASALPGSLEGAVAALRLPHRKDADGHRVMKQMAKPQKGAGWIDGPERRERLHRYCVADVEAERGLFHAVRPLSPEEQALWVLDAEINARGFHVDVELARAAQKIVRQEQAAIDAEISELTNGAITKAGQVGKIQAFVYERGHQLKGLTKRSVSAVLARGEPAEDVRRLLELRSEGARASVRKLDSLLAGADIDGRLRGTLKYWGAATGRWSGRGFQPQNLKRPEGGDLDAAVNAVLSRNLDRVRELGAPLSIVGDISRSMICAAPGHVLFAADFSTVESRILAWLAGENWKLANFREFDRTGDPALDNYLVAATRVLKRPVPPEDETGRHIGKLCDLSFQYGGALGAWRRFDDSDNHSDADVERYKCEWRNAHPQTTRFWRKLESSIKQTIRRTGERVTLGSLAFHNENGTLYITLPGGRRITYPEVRIEPGKFDGTTQVVFKDNARGAWADTRAWFGTFTENVVQGTARDLLAAAMWRIERAGYPITLHVHDEIVAEVPEGFGSIGEFRGLMVEPPAWATGLPVAAKVWVGERYSKSKTKTQSEALAPKAAPAAADIDEPEKVCIDDF